ncbi:MAG: 30S ribosomal protein S4e [Candidatus Odinarchaeia archaeon]
MAKLGPKHHLKRLNAPKAWGIPKKQFKWVVRPCPGPHKKGNYIPLLIIVRDMLGYAKTIKETKYILSHKMILVNDKPRTDFKYPVGLMDVISIPKTKEFFRILLKPRKGLMLHPISKKESTLKLVKIDGKITLSKGDMQFNLHDGTNIVVKSKDMDKTGASKFKVKDALLLNLANNKIKEHIPLKEGVYALTIAGKNIGYYGKIKKIEHHFGPLASTVTLSNDKIGDFQTALDYVFPIGVDKPVISLPEVD